MLPDKKHDRFKVWPESKTSPVDRPLAKAERTAFLQRKKAGISYFSNMISQSFSRLDREFHDASDIMTGWYLDSDVMNRL